MNKKTLGVLGVITVLILVVFSGIRPQHRELPHTLTSLVQSKADIIRYRISDAYTEYGLLSLYFIESTDAPVLAQVAIDVNSDGAFTEDEWIIRNKPTRPAADVANRLGFTLPAELKQVGTKSVAVFFTLTFTRVSDFETLTPQAITVNAPIEDVQIVEQFGLNVPGAREDLKRGIGTLAYAEDFEESGSNIDTTALPDLAGGPMDCFAIATANNLINMATKHGKRDQLPENPAELVAELKNFMNWNNGIVNADFLQGKNDFVQVTGLPITTEEIQRPSLEDLHDAFSSGDAVEVSTTMLRSASGQKNTGHVFTGVSTYQDGGDAGLAVHDPATPEGTDILDLSMSGGDTPYVLVKYPMWDGIVIVDAIYIQRWNESETNTAEQTGVDLREEEEKPATSVGQAGELYKKEVEIETTYAHVKPGEYSEVYAVVTGLTPGDDAEARLNGGGHKATPQVVTVDENGVAHFTYRITQYGEYTVTVFVSDGTELEAKPLTVQ